MLPSGEAPGTGHAGLTMRPDTDRLRTGCLFVISGIYVIQAFFSCAHLDVVAFGQN